MSDRGVQKVYISDSPVADDTLQYNYVNSDIDDEPNSSAVEATSQPYAASPKQMLSHPDFSEIDELAKEAEYQRELQSRLQKTSVTDRPRSVDQMSNKSPVDTPSNLQWKNPPVNPLTANEAVFASKRADNVPVEGFTTPSTHALTAAAVTSIAHPAVLRSGDGSRNMTMAAHNDTGLGEQPAVLPAAIGQTNRHQPLSPQVDYSQQVQAGQQPNTQYMHTASSPQLDLYSQQYEQLQRQQLEQQQQLLVQQHLLQQQEREKQQAHMAENLLLQRNAPVMYMQTSQKDSEYYAVTPRNAYHPYIGHQEQSPGPQATVRAHDQADKINTTPDAKGYVAPKPIRPPKNYVEKNKIRAGGQQSAKPGYSQRLMQSKAEKEVMKDWAPGMIIPRKKASSADDIVRAGVREDMTSAEDVWSKRSHNLAIAKQGKLTGGSKVKKKSHINSELKRVASDSHIWEEGARVGGKGDGYLAAYHSTSINWQNSQQAVQDYAIPGQVSNNMHVMQHPSQPSPIYHSSIPVHPAIGQHQNVTQALPMAYPLTPTAEGKYYQHDNGYHGYHHQPRLHNQPGHFSHPYSDHPAYSYTGYMNSSKVELANSEGYEGSLYSSPHPLSGVSVPATKQPQSNRVLNPYTTVPPITNALKPAADHLSYTGSYLLAHQKDKEKADRLQKGPTYKVYTMKDYKKLKLEYKLGGLGPSQDPTELKEKNEMRSKQLQYARGVVELEKTKPHVSPRQMANEQVQQISGRQLAVEYAKHIPKPKPTVHGHSVPQQSDRSNAIDSEPGKISALKPIAKEHNEHVDSADTATPIIDIDDLKRRHEEERQSAAEIQYKIQQAA